MPAHDIIVVGASAGGVEATAELARGLPEGLPAAVFVVVHTTPDGPGYLPQILGRAGPLPSAHAEDGQPIEPGRIYVARPDRHLLLELGRVRVTRGPKENRTRPAIDPLFRSAALAYGPRVVGVILTGTLDDGAAGLWAVKACGGVAVVQDPLEARFSSMPRSAMRQARVDHCLRLADIPAILAGLAAREAPTAESRPAPDGLAAETRIAMGDQALQAGAMELGEPSPFTCPECHGTLLRMKSGGGVRFRCHTGHAFTADCLLAELTEATEGALWTAVRAVQEGSILMRHIADHVRDAGDIALADAYRSKADAAIRRSEEVRRAAIGSEIVSDGTLRDALRQA